MASSWEQSAPPAEDLLIPFMRSNPVERFFSPRLGGRQHGEKSEEAQECSETPRP
jgi:hypothetical protein